MGGSCDVHTSLDGTDMQKCVVEVVPRMVVFRRMEAMSVSTVWLISYEMHESADDDAHSPSSIITQSD